MRSRREPYTSGKFYIDGEGAPRSIRAASTGYVGRTFPRTEA